MVFLLGPQGESPYCHRIDASQRFSHYLGYFDFFLPPEGQRVVFLRPVICEVLPEEELARIPSADEKR